MGKVLLESNIGRKVGLFWFVIGAMMISGGWLVGDILVNSELAEILLIGSGIGILLIGFNYAVFSKPKKDT